jgi:predicted transcriptional regulator of viral defense system
MIQVLPNVLTNEDMKTKRNTAGRAPKAPTAAIVRLGRRAGILRPRDLEREGVPRVYLQRMVRRGLLLKHGRGLYGLPDAEVTEHHSLAQVGKRIPHGVICLLSALRYYGLTTQTPFEVWIALDRGARSPRIGEPKLRVVRFSGAAMKAGIEVKAIEGVSVRIYGVAKTVADCFKYRNKIGIDVAIEALRESWRGKRCTMDEFWRFAKVCRVANVMHPYLEMLT